jgi:Uma2 family endonuclease
LGGKRDGLMDNRASLKNTPETGRITRSLSTRMTFHAAAAGASPLVRPPVPYDGKLFTIADLEALPCEVPSGSVDYELDDGRLITISPPVIERSIVQTHLMFSLHDYELERRLGVAYGRVAVVLWRNPDRLVSPAAAFQFNHSRPPKLSPEGYLETVPEVVVEIRCRYTSEPYLERKISDYLLAGARAVVVAEPATETIVIHRSHANPQKFGPDAVLELEDVLPGFRCSVTRIFSEDH